MKKIFVTGSDLFMSLFQSPLHSIGKKTSSFSIEINFLESGKVNQGKLVISGRDTIYSNGVNTLLSFSGIITTDGKESRYFTGICDEDNECHLLVADPEIFKSNISKQEFIQIAKTYCYSRGIPTHEDGNVIGEGFPLFENLPKDAHAPAPFMRDRNHKDMEVSTIMHDDYFPITYWREKTEGKQYEVCFGKFISEYKIKVFTREEMYLLGKQTLFA